MALSTRAWQSVARALAGTGFCALIGWISFGRGNDVPLLDQFDLGIHELGHMLALAFPTMVMFIMGSVAQVAVPVGLAAYFLLARREPVSAGVLLAWAGTSARDVSVYIADAPYQALPLLGNGEHDWAYLLGSRGWDAIESAGSIAGNVKLGGGLAVFTGLTMCMYAAIKAGGLLDGRPIQVPSASGQVPRMRPARFRPDDGADPFPRPKPDPALTGRGPPAN